MNQKVKLRVLYLDGSREEQIRNAQKKNGSWRVSFRGRFYFIKMDDCNTAHLILCDKCRSVGGLLIEEKTNETKHACFKCEFDHKEEIDQLIYKGQTSQKLKSIGGFVIAKHPRKGVQIFDQFTEPSHLGKNQQKITKNWLIIKYFKFEKGRWIEEADPNFFQKIRGNWLATREIT